MSEIIDGKALALKIREEVKSGVAQLKKQKGIVPGLATVLVGQDPASQVYVKNKNKACQECGMVSHHQELPASTTQDQLLKLIDQLNRDSAIHGILVQLPLPKQINPDKIIEAIHPKKDVDGFHPINMGNLLIGRPSLQPCTPYGIMKMLESINYDLAGKNAVVVGRSNIVGKPIAIMLLARHATVTICHSRTKDLAGVVQSADLVIAAIGKPEMIQGDWIKKGAVVIDVGINRLLDGKLVGDVQFESASKRASYITPVPGGVGPMTIAMLLWNTLEATREA